MAREQKIASHISAIATCWPALATVWWSFVDDWKKKEVDALQLIMNLNFWLFGRINLNKTSTERMCVEGERQTTSPCGFVHVWNRLLFFRLECCASSSYLSLNLFSTAAFIFQGLVMSPHTSLPSLWNRFWHLQLLIFHFLCNHSMRLLTRDVFI